MTRAGAPGGRRPDRGGESLAGPLAAATWLALVAGAVGTALPGRPGASAGVLAVAVVVAAPLGRVAWLGWSWARTGDRRFALTSLALLAVVALGAAAALALE